MCLRLNNDSKIVVADKDIVCYKVFCKRDNTLTSPYQHMCYECGTTYVSETPITVKHDFTVRNYVEEGFHSFSNKKEAQDFASTLQTWLWPSGHPYVAIKCLIPAGTRYVAGFFFEFRKSFASFCSERIIAVEEV